MSKKIVAVAVGVALVAVVLLSWGSDSSSEEEPAVFSPAEVEETIRGAYEAELRDKKRARQLVGRIVVVDVRCRPAGSRGDRLDLCAAVTASTGEAQRVAPPMATIRVDHLKPGSFEYEVVED